MPELPEVEVVRRGLLPHTVGRTITEVEVLDPRIIRRQVGGADRLRGGLEGSSLTALVRRGKFLWWRLADEDGAELGERSEERRVGREERAGRGGEVKE